MKNKEFTKKSVKAAESYGWVVDENEAWEAYEFACDYLGKETVDDEIVRGLSVDELAASLAYMFRMYDFREWEERNNEDEDIEESTKLRGRRAIKSSRRPMRRNKKPVKAARVYRDGFGDYKPWSGAVDTWDALEKYDKIDALEQAIDEIFYDESAGTGIINETELNDLLWFEPGTVAEWVGLYYNDDTAEFSDEPFEEEEEEDEE